MSRCLDAASNLIPETCSKKRCIPMSNETATPRAHRRSRQPELPNLMNVQQHGAGLQAVLPNASDNGHALLCKTTRVEFKFVDSPNN
eukprot:3091419-Amphidinium_carterae.1